MPTIWSQQLPQRDFPEQKETIHMMQMLRNEACSGQIEDLAHVVSADCLTKASAKPYELAEAVSTSVLKNLDMHQPFRSLLKRKSLPNTVASQHLWPSSTFL